MKRETLLIILLSIFLTSCGVSNSDTDSDSGAVSVAYESLIESFQTETEMHEFETVVIENESDSDDFLSRFPTDDFTRARLTNVNFADSLIVGVFVGARPNTSYAVRIDSVLVNAASSLVYVTESGSASGGRAVTWPAAFVRMDKNDFNSRSVGFPYKRICHEDPCAWPYSILPDAGE